MNLHGPIGDLFRKVATATRSKEGEGSGGVVVIPPMTEVVVTESEVDGESPGYFPIVLGIHSHIDPTKDLIQIVRQSAGRHIHRRSRLRIDAVLCKVDEVGKVEGRPNDGRGKVVVVVVPVEVETRGDRVL